MDDLDRHIEQQVEADPAFADLLREAEAELNFGLELARLREMRGWTQRELAARAQMPQSAIARLEKAGRVPTLTTLWRLTDALNATIMLGPDLTVKLVDRVAETAITAVPTKQVSVATMDTTESPRIGYAAFTSSFLFHAEGDHTLLLGKGTYVVHPHGIHALGSPPKAMQIQGIAAASMIQPASSGFERETSYQSVG
ncbi:MAG: helix-turn-helix domain-containing protein [Dehalococcoidia bacterium]